MFSAEFTTAHKYNLKTRERISTVSIMPYDYTSLYDPQYLPNLDEKSFDVLKSFCAYRFLHTLYELHDDAKLVKIEYHDDTILKYEIVNSFPYHLVSTDIRNWNHFISTIKCEEMATCKAYIDRMTDTTDIGVTYLTSVEYDENCDFKYVNIFDSDYNLVGYDDNASLHLINSFCKSFDGSTHQPVGVIGFSHNGDIKVSIKLSFNDGSYRYEKLSPLPTRVENTPKSQQREYQISQMVAYGLIDPDDLDFMDSIFSDDSRCDFEYILNEDGTIKDIYLYHYVTYEFKKLAGA